MKNLLYLFVFLMLASCDSGKNIKVTVSNTSDVDFSDDMVEIPLSDVSSKLTLKDRTQTYVVKNQEGTVVPSQITYDGKLLFQTSVKPSEKEVYTISLGAKIDFESKVFGRFYPERKGDFAWENDRIGFRFYGDSLRYTDGPSNALDLWLKRTDKMILDKWYYDELVNKKTYHVDHGEGCDPYNVGRTLGAGNIAPFVNDSLYLNANFLAYQILDKGPLRFSFRLDYPSINIDGKDISESKVISLDAGSQLTKIEQSFGFTEDTPVAVGIVKRPTGDSIMVSKALSTLVYEEPSMGDNGQVFLGIVVPEGIVRDTIFSYDYINPVNKKQGVFTNVLAISNYQPNKTFVYYTGFGWSKFGFNDGHSFNKYVQNYSKKLKTPLNVKID